MQFLLVSTEGLVTDQEKEGEREREAIVSINSTESGLTVICPFSSTERYPLVHVGKWQVSLQDKTLRDKVLNF